MITFPEVDKDILRAKVYFALKTRSLSPENWENILSASIGATWIPGDKYLADGVKDDWALNIKTISMKPRALKTDPYDFQSRPESFPSSQQVVQRRINLPAKVNETFTSPAVIGYESLKNYADFVKDSHDKFNTSRVLDVLARHGISRCGKKYLVTVSLFDHCFLQSADINWVEKLGGPNSKQKGRRVSVDGYVGENLVVRRNGSNSGIYQTNLIFWLQLDSCHNCFEISVPLPELLEFDLQSTLNEIDNSNFLLLAR